MAIHRFKKKQTKNKNIDSLFILMCNVCIMNISCQNYIEYNKYS